MKEPVDHILRPTLPWRKAHEVPVTECGFNAAKVTTLSREEYFRRVKDLGQQRAAMMTCMTCSQTAGRWGTWEDDPRLAMSREIEWERGSMYYRARTDRGQLLRDELLAVAALIEAHRDEFEASVSEIEGRREWLEKKAAMERKAKPVQPMRGL